MNRFVTLAAIMLAALILGSSAPAQADAGGYGPGPGLTGNSLGGVITWSPYHQRIARRWAAAHCARYRKLARITSVYPRYGQYIGFDCSFPRGRMMRYR